MPHDTDDDRPTDDASPHEYHHEVDHADERAHPGERVRDRSGDAKLRVIAEANRTADNWSVAATGKTVAEHNPSYPEDAPVLLATYESNLDETFDDVWRTWPPSLLGFRTGDLGVKCYSFPAHRLSVIDDEWPPEYDGASDDGGESDE